MEVIIHKEHIATNLQYMKQRQKDIILVVKNDAYHFGTARVVEIALQNGVTHFMVTDLATAKAVRKQSEAAYIIVMRAVDSQEIKQLKEFRCATIIPSFSWYCQYQDEIQDIDLHLKINVGMNRFGLSNIDEIESVMDMANEKNHRIVGLCTHFPQADEVDLSEHHQQVQQFCDIYQILLAKGKQFDYIHAENSATFMQNDERLDFCQFARIGILAYGYSPTVKQQWLKPGVSCFAKVIQIRELQKGDHLGYGVAYCAKEDEQIAILDIGYGDGLIRKRIIMPAYIHNKAYPFVGRISMSHAYLKVDGDVHVGDQVEIFGEHIQIDDLMRIAGDVANSEILASLHMEESVE